VALSPAVRIVSVGAVGRRGRHPDAATIAAVLAPPACLVRAHVVVDDDESALEDACASTA
jgi:hypothetical protein